MPYLKTVRVKTYGSPTSPPVGSQEARPVRKPYAATEIVTSVKPMVTDSKYRRKGYIYKPF